VDYSLSSWKNENSIFDEGLFIAPKTYALKRGSKEIVKIKGIPKNSISFEQFKFQFKQQKPLQFKNLIEIQKKNFKIKKENIQKSILNPPFIKNL
jgi:hypothetical protein